MQYAIDGSSVIAKLGDTAVLAVIQATLEEPRSQRCVPTVLACLEDAGVRRMPGIEPSDVSDIYSARLAGTDVISCLLS